MKKRRNSLKMENKEIRASLIKSYEILEEKLDQTNANIDILKTELKRGSNQEKKREKRNIF